MVCGCFFFFCFRVIHCNAVMQKKSNKNVAPRLIIKMLCERTRSSRSSGISTWMTQRQSVVLCSPEDVSLLI